MIQSRHHHHHQSLNCEGRWGTTDDFTTSFLHLSLFSTALWNMTNSRPVHSLVFSSHLFLCPPCLLPPPPPSLCLARWFWPDLMNRRQVLTTAVCVSLWWSGGLLVVPIACWILTRTSSLVTRFLMTQISLMLMLYFFMVANKAACQTLAKTNLKSIKTR